MASSDGEDLIAFLGRTVQQNRLKTIENVYNNKGGLASNFQAEWRGFSKNGRSTVRVDGRDMNVRTLGATALRNGNKCFLRVGPGVLTANW